MKFCKSATFPFRSLKYLGKKKKVVNVDMQNKTQPKCQN